MLQNIKTIKFSQTLKVLLYLYGRGQKVSFGGQCPLKSAYEYTAQSESEVGNIA